ncbi:hypothetical protein [Paenibacillus tyrfis]|uniref:hypothetical protein n=1 Tax=Paenibacillus tyrfis TaxID=1501230 RepID=UPI00209FEA64|nr:hypothetical protein [Paenibacillus tyrfis]MCP1312107.1 hypothetical protein [Paenibacillus tyrfis]
MNADNLGASRKIDILRLLKRTIYFAFAVLMVKLIRYYILSHQEQVGAFVTELHSSGVSTADAIRTLMIMLMIIACLVIISLIVFRRWKALDGKVFYIFYFLILDALMVYFFPGVFESLLGLR